MQRWRTYGSGAQMDVVQHRKISNGAMYQVNQRQQCVGVCCGSFVALISRHLATEQ